MAKTLLEGHEAYRANAFARSRDFLQLLASEGQSPDALFIGCSDSRVVPELLTNSSPGSLFVVRNIANVVPVLEHPDASVGAAIEYAVGHLRVAHVVVCGHTCCGGVMAAMSGIDRLHDLPSLKEWLSGAIQPAIDQVARTEATGPALDADVRWRRVVEENVVVQLGNLLAFPCVAEAVRADELELHGWVYDLHDVALSVYDPTSRTFRRAAEVLAQPVA
jgi:carbonic anhydrase